MAIFRTAPHRIVLLSLLLCLTGSIQAQPTEEKEKPRLAILDIKAGEGASPALADFSSNMLQTAMVNTRLFTIVERKQLDAVIKEQALKHSGCTDTSCVVQIGQLLAASKIMTGTLVKVGSKYYINAQIVDVELGKLDFAESNSADSLDGLETAIQELAAKIAGRITGVDTSSLVPQKATEWPYIWRSIVFPGWGQYHNGDRGWAKFFAGSFVGLGAAYFGLRTKYLNTAAHYSDPIVPLVPIYLYWNTLEQSSRSSNIALGPTIIIGDMSLSQLKSQEAGERRRLRGAAISLAALYLWNVIHSMVSERNTGVGELNADVPTPVVCSIYYRSEKQFGILTDRQWTASLIFVY